MSRKLAHLLGGNLTVESGAKGTAFTLWLPIAASVPSSHVLAERSSST